MGTFFLAHPVCIIIFTFLFSQLFSQWNPRDADPLITLIDVWAPVLPEWVTSNLLDQLVMPRLQVGSNLYLLAVILFVSRFRLKICIGGNSLENKKL